MKRSLLSIALLTLAISSVSAAGKSGEIIVTWNQVTVKATKAAGLNSNLGSRIEAIEAIAVYDAVNSIEHFGTPYHYNVPAKGKASAQAAAAYAAHAVLVNYFPAQKPALDSVLTS